MNLELSTLNDGGVLLIGDETMPDIVKRIEYYCDQRLMTLIYKDENLVSDIFEYEVPENMIQTVEQSPDIMMYVMFKNHAPIGYKVPLIKVGALY